MIDVETKQATLDLSTFKGDVDKVAETVDTKIAFTADTSAIERQLAKLSKKTMKIPASIVNRYGRVVI